MEEKQIEVLERIADALEEISLYLSSISENVDDATFKPITGESYIRCVNSISHMP